LYFYLKIQVCSTYNGEHEYKINIGITFMDCYSLLCFVTAKVQMQNERYFRFLCKSADRIIQTNSQSGRRDYVKQLLFIQVFFLFRAVLYEL
jgi:hypothetical protein